MKNSTVRKRNLNSKKACEKVAVTETKGDKANDKLIHERKARILRAVVAERSNPALFFPQERKKKTGSPSANMAHATTQIEMAEKKEFFY